MKGDCVRPWWWLPPAGAADHPIEQTVATAGVLALWLRHAQCRRVPAAAALNRRWCVVHLAIRTIEHLPSSQRRARRRELLSHHAQPQPRLVERLAHDAILFGDLARLDAQHRHLCCERLVLLVALCQLVVQGGHLAQHRVLVRPRRACRVYHLVARGTREQPRHRREPWVLRVGWAARRHRLTAIFTNG